MCRAFVPYIIFNNIRHAFTRRYKFASALHTSLQSSCMHTKPRENTCRHHDDDDDVVMMMVNRKTIR